MESSIQSAKTRQGADCGSDYELVIAKFRLKLKKVGRTPRPSFIILILKKKKKRVRETTLIPYTKDGNFTQY